VRQSENVFWEEGVDNMKFHKDPNWSLWSERSFDKTSQYKVSGQCNSMYIKRFKWEISNPN